MKLFLAIYRLVNFTRIMHKNEVYRLFMPQTGNSQLSEARIDFMG